MSESNTQNGNYVDKKNNTSEWLENQNFFGDEFKDELESIAESSIVYSSDGENSETSDSDNDENSLTTLKLGTQIDVVKQKLSEVIHSTNSIQTVGNVNIQNSTNVHIGNITNIKIYADVRLKHSKSKDNTETNENKTKEQATKTINEEVKNSKQNFKLNAFIEPQKPKIIKNACSIMPRYMWLAQKALAEYEYIPKPVEYVIISHTATESSEKQSANVRCIRYIQCFHIESNGWDDIGYNFLVGCDGNIYEGRGWGIVGAHTLHYNEISVGIAFIGCFMQELPNKAALNACKNLLQKGVKEGRIAANYKLVCACQCRPTESPGRALFNEMKTWEHFYNMDDDDE